MNINRREEKRREEKNQEGDMYDTKKIGQETGEQDWRIMR
jgi:hypothetical protein